MKITHVDIHLLEKKLNYQMNISRGGFSIRRHAIVQIHTDEGIMGFGEGIGDAQKITLLLQSSLSKSLIGKNPLNINLILSDLTKNNVYFEAMGSFMSALSAIEMACIDIKAKYANLSICDLLGGKCHEKFEVYASDVYWERDGDKMAENALRIKKLGIGAIKIHIGVESPSLEFEKIKKIREAIGYDTKLMLDLNAGYSLPQAIEAFRIWRDFEPYWIEEPLLPGETAALKILSNTSDIMIAQGENIVGLSSFKDVLDSESTHVLMPDIGRVGGINEAVKIFNLASSYGVSVSPHNFSSGILLNFTIQLMASQKNSFLLEIDTSGNAVYEEFLVKPISIENGELNVSNVVMDIDRLEEVINRYKVN
jgi:D-galactarolactone cycloisomerase